MQWSPHINMIVYYPDSPSAPSFEQYYYSTASSVALYVGYLATAPLAAVYAL
jgi:hypothetical protein